MAGCHLVSSLEGDSWWRSRSLATGSSGYSNANPAPGRVTERGGPCATVMGGKEVGAPALVPKPALRHLFSTGSLLPSGPRRALGALCPKQMPAVPLEDPQPCPPQPVSLSAPAFQSGRFQGQRQDCRAGGTARAGPRAFLALTWGSLSSAFGPQGTGQLLGALPQGGRQLWQRRMFWKHVPSGRALSLRRPAGRGLSLVVKGSHREQPRAEPPASLSPAGASVPTGRRTCFLMGRSQRGRWALKAGVEGGRQGPKGPRPRQSRPLGGPGDCAPVGTAGPRGAQAPPPVSASPSSPPRRAGTDDAAPPLRETPTY